MELKEVKNQILIHNPTLRFTYNETNIAKMLKIGVIETRQHIKQMLNDGFIQIKDDHVIITNDESLAISKKEVFKYYIICGTCKYCINKRYFNRYKNGHKYHCVSCFCTLHRHRITEMIDCVNYEHK